MEFRNGVLEGFGWMVGLVLVFAAGLSFCAGAVGGLVLVWRWMATILRGGCA